MKRILLSLVLLGATAPVFAQVPAMVGYQGRLTAAGTNFNGNGFFKFALVQQTTNLNRTATVYANIVAGGISSISIIDGGAGYTAAPNVNISPFPGSPGTGATATAILTGGSVTAIQVLTPGNGYNVGAIVNIDPPPANYAVVSFWSDSGSTLDGVEPVFPVTLPVVNGLFNVNLGQPGVTVFLDPGLFETSPMWLRVWFSANGTNFQRLSPDQPLASAPYAMMAANAANATNALNATSAGTAATMPWGGLTGVPAGAGLLLTTSNTFNVVFGGSGSSNSVARSDHDHFGQSWTGSAPMGLAITNNSSAIYSASLFGSQGGATPLSIGLSGVRGASTTGYGLLGESASGTAVMGSSTGPTGTTYGVQGFVTSPNGIAVYGIHSAFAGPTPGVQGETASSDSQAAGVLGRTTSPSASYSSAGVRGQSEGVSTTGIGVLGYSGPSGPTTLGYANSGVYGISMVNGGNGVVGQADNGSGAYGVWGTSAAGIGGFFNGGSQGVYGYSPLAYGGYFSGGSYGVFGSGSSGTGGYFSGGTNGVYGISSGGSGGRFSGTSYGLFSTASVGSGGYFSGNVYGVYSVASAGYGGSFSGTTYGVSANASAGTGGNFSGSANGVTATGGSIGVIGNSTSTGVQGNGYNGVWGVATSNGNGVWGQADIGTSAYAVYGTSANGYGGYFSGGAYGIYGLGATYLSYDSSLSRANLEIHDTGIGNYARLRLSSSSYPYWDIAVGGGANVMNFYNNTNGNVMSLTAGGDLSVATITIRGGADVAEPFQMSHQDIPKGAVVIIDAKHPGQLKLSERAYDTRVAGIVSGANGIQPGLSLHQEGAIAGGQNVALTGRVYVQADASNGPIQPGDLLTTSDIPGYAMKVTDHTRAQGAILGKAMTELPEGKGNVLVLVTLQ